MTRTLVEHSDIDIADLLTAAASPDSGLPISRRSLEHALEIIVTDPHSREWYLNKLKSLTRKNYRYLCLLQDSDLDGILSERFCSLTDQTLLTLFLNPAAILQVSNELIDSCPESWSDVYKSLGDEIMRREQFTVLPCPFEKPRKGMLLSTSLGVPATEMEGKLAKQSNIQRCEPITESQTRRLKWWPDDVPVGKIPPVTLRLELLDDCKLYVAFLDESSGNPRDSLRGFATWTGAWATRDYVPPDDPRGLNEDANVRAKVGESEKGQRNLKSDSPYEPGDVLVLYLTNAVPAPHSWERIRLVLAISPMSRTAE